MTPGRTRWFKTFSIAAWLCVLGAAAAAQEERVLEDEIKVTAQKREQNLQDVPVSVTVRTGEQLARYGITDVFDLQQTTPGLIVDRSQSANTANFQVRGIGTSAQNFGLESSVGLYVDGVYRSRQAALINELADIDQVELVRGPQGTLFGRNTQSGAVLFSTRAPSHETDGYLELTYGNLDLFSANGAFGGSLAEDLLAARITAFTASRDGYVDNDGDPHGNVVNDRNRMGGRAQLLYTPREELSARLILDYAELDEVCCASPTFLNNFAGVGNRAGSDALLARLGVPVLDDERFEDNIVSLNSLPLSYTRDQGVSVEINWRGAAGALTSVTAVRSFDVSEELDADFSKGDVLSRTSEGESDTFSQELRFAGAFARFSYLAGAYYFTQDLDSRAQLSFGEHVDQFIKTGVDDGLTQVVAGVNALSAATGGAVPMAAASIPAGASSLDAMQQEHRAWALFGRVDFRPLERLELSAGLRYTDERKKLHGEFTQGNQGPPPQLAAIGAHLQAVSAGTARPDTALLAPLFAPGWGFYVLPVFAPRPDVDETLNDSRVTWDADVSWFVTDDVMLYAGYGTGFKGGGTNTDRIAANLSQLFDAETSESFEAGAKLEFPRRNLRANLSLHYTITKDYQNNTFTGTGFSLQNAGKVNTRGGELEVTWQPRRGMTLSGAYVYNDAEYDSFEQGNCWVATPFHTGAPDPGSRQGSILCDRSGDRVSGNPEHTVILLASSIHRLSDNLSGYLHVDYSYRSSIMRDGNADPLKLAGGFDLVNLRGGLVLEKIDLDIALWARNVFDKHWYGAVYDVPLQTGKLNSYAREPRTFGVTLRKQF